jgi:MFS transporter, DHA3 family, tetracycline resistance protein
VVVGYLIIGVSFVVSGSFPVFEMIAFGSFLMGIGWTFVSGAHEAWLADEVGTARAGRLYLTGKKLSSYGTFIGIAIAMLLGSVQINYPYVLAGVLFIFWGMFAWVAMPETGFKPGTEISTFKTMGRTLSTGFATISRSRSLVLLMIVGVIFGTFSEGYDRLSTAHLLRSFDFPTPWGMEPVMLFGVMVAMGSLLTIILVTAAEKLVNTEKSVQIARWLSGMTLLIIALVLTFALTGHVWLAIAMGVLLQPLRGVVDPLTMAWLNQNIPSRIRATVISMHGQADALGQMAGGPGVGLVGREMGMRVAITLSGLLLAPAVWLYLRHREQDNVTVE